MPATGPSRLTERAAMTLPSSSRSAPEDVEDLVDLRGHPVAEFGGAEPAFDDGAVGTRADPRSASARAPPSRCSPVTTIVLPVPVSPVSTVSPRSNSAVAVLMAPSDSMRISESTTVRASP